MRHPRNPRIDPDPGTLVHEAAHAVTAIRVGCRVHYISLKQERWCGRIAAAHCSWGSSPDQRFPMEDIFAVQAAGYAAEEMFCIDVGDLWERTWGDREDLREVLALNGQSSDSDTVDRAFRRGIHLARGYLSEVRSNSALRALLRMLAAGLEQGTRRISGGDIHGCVEAQLFP